jgi:anti-sigma factor RsiW
MSNHLSAATLNALADGELTQEDLAYVTEHLQACAVCTTHALEKTLLKTATMRAGQRYEPSDDLRRRMERLVSSDTTEWASGQLSRERRPERLMAWMGWAVAAILLVSSAGTAWFETLSRRTQAARIESSAALTEMRDQHIATLAANEPPQVLSSDRHTVKPWFQGKTPFSFNLPENLPADVKLEGANLTYLHNRPVAQLLYSIGRHRVSVFVQERTGAALPEMTPEPKAGYSVARFRTNDLDAVAISDVDAMRLKELTALIERVQQ